MHVFKNLDLERIPEMTQDLKKIVGITLRELRKENGFTQEKLALDVGLSPING